MKTNQKKSKIMNLKSEDIKVLRDKSGAGMMDCKKALDEPDGNIEKAILIFIKTRNFFLQSF